MARNEDDERDCFAIAKDFRIDEELQDLDRINRERLKNGQALLTYTEYKPEIHRVKPA